MQTTTRTAELLHQHGEDSAHIANPQPNPQDAMSYTTSANFGSPRGSVKSLKSLIGPDSHAQSHISLRGLLPLNFVEVTEIAVFRRKHFNPQFTPQYDNLA
jgi:hypothetical protein